MTTTAIDFSAVNARLLNRLAEIKCNMQATIGPAFDALIGCTWQRRQIALSYIGAARG